jgi:hypothetical protein
LVPFPFLVMASRGFYETAGGSRNFVPARAGLVPAIHVEQLLRCKTWMPGTSPGMAVLGGKC